MENITASSELASREAFARTANAGFVQKKNNPESSEKTSAASFSKTSESQKTSTDSSHETRPHETARSAPSREIDSFEISSKKVKPHESRSLDSTEKPSFGEEKSKLAHSESTEKSSQTSETEKSDLGKVENSRENESVAPEKDTVNSEGNVIEFKIFENTDDTTGKVEKKVVVLIRDKETGEVVGAIPPEEFMKAKANSSSFKGLLFNKLG